MNVLMMTHEILGAANLALARHFFGELPEHAHIIAVAPDDTPETIWARAQALLQAQPDASWLVLTDIFGATPCNVARRLLAHPNTAVLTGINAPMVIKALQYAPKVSDLNEFVAMVQHAAQEGIMRVLPMEEDTQC